MPQIILIILVYVLGPAAVVFWSIKRFKSGVKPEAIEIIALLFAVFLIGLLMFSYSTNVTRDDSAELEAIVSELTTRYDFPVQAKFQDIPAVFGEKQARSLQLNIYGVTDAAEQAKIHQIVIKLRKQIASKPIVINFLKEEVWEEKEDGTRLPNRKQEVSLRRMRAE